MTIYGAFHVINYECSDKQTNCTITNTAKPVIRRIFCQRIVIFEVLSSEGDKNHKLVDILNQV